MELWNNRRVRDHARHLCGRLHGDEGGQISLVSCFAILGLAVLIGLVGNAGHGTVEKLKMQHAADAVAFSSAQWMARGMNGVTATNHMLGETTALAAVLESLGGPEVDAGMEFTPPQSQALDKMIQSLKNTAPIRGLPTYVPPPVTDADTRLINFVVDRVAPTNGRKHRAFATIYDAKMTLKRELAKRLILKTAANVGLFVPPPWGYISAAIAYAIHVHSSYELIAITKEWLILEGLEIAVVGGRGFKVQILEGQLIPALAVHGDFLAGNVPGAVGGTGIVNVALGDQLQYLTKAYGAAEMHTYPQPRNFRLPIQPEPGPTLRGDPNAVEWGNDAPPPTAADKDLKNLTDDVQKRKRAIRRRITQLQQDIATFDRLEAPLDRRLREDKELEPADRQAILQEKEALAAARQEKQQALAKTRQELAKLENEEKEINATVTSYAQLPATNGNLSVQHLPKSLLDPRAERYTQWVRATYPYVDAYRAPILAQFKSQLERSQAAEHFVKWTNRYTLVKAWQFRSGYRFKRVSQQQGRYQKDAGARVCRMYVMKEAFSQGARPTEQKGAEPWTRGDAAGKRRAELMFTVLGIVHGDPQPLFSPVVFPAATEHGMTTVSQAIFYNANDQQPRTVATNAQPVIGWDTLNWDPATATPEWGSRASETAPMWPWEIFQGARQLGSAKVKLNWQAKLMPVTKGRLRAATTEFAATAMNRNLGLATLHADRLISH